MVVLKELMMELQWVDLKVYLMDLLMVTKMVLTKASMMEDNIRDSEDVGTTEGKSESISDGFVDRAEDGNKDGFDEGINDRAI